MLYNLCRFYHKMRGIWIFIPLCKINNMLQKQSLVISAVLLNIHMWDDDDEYCQKEDRNECWVEKACFLSASFYQKPISCEETAHIFFFFFFLQGMAPHIKRCICTHSHRYLRRLVNRSNIYFLLYTLHPAVQFSMGKKRTLFKSGSLLRRLRYTPTHSSHSFMSADVPPCR